MSDFVESVLLLLMTALVTGFIVPLILKQIDSRRQQEASAAEERRFREQKRFEAELARQSKVIDSQGELLNAITDLLWEYQLSLIAVPYYHQFPEHRDRYLEATKEYTSNAGDRLGRIRAEISKGMRLTTDEAVRRLRDLYYGTLLRVDLQVTELIERDLKGDQANDREWVEFQQSAVDELSALVDSELSHLAASLQLNQTVTR